jgi:hypothetical protein
MKRIAVFVFVCLLAFATQWSFLPARSAESIPAQADGVPRRAFTLFLPVISQGGASAPTVVPTVTPTLISTAPTAAATLPPTATATATAPLATSTPAATATSTTTPVATPTPSATATPIQTPTATNTATSTPPANATATRTPTAQPTSITFPDVTFSCPQEPALNNNVWLYLTVTITEPAPSSASFFFEPTEFQGPVDEIVKPLSALTNIFTNETTARSPGRLAKCNSAGQCTAVYTLTETEVTRYIGTKVNCPF